MLASRCANYVALYNYRSLVMWCLRGENPVSQLAAIKGGSMDSGSDDEVLGIALLTVLLSRRQKRRRSKRKMWVRSILS